MTEPAVRDPPVEPDEFQILNDMELTRLNQQMKDMEASLPLLSRHQSSKDTEKKERRLICTICSYPFSNPIVIHECQHAFCEHCLAKARLIQLGYIERDLSEIPEEHINQVEDFSRGKPKCPTCGARIVIPPMKCHLLHQMAEQYAEEELVVIPPPDCRYKWPQPHPLTIEYMKERSKF
ncbi:tripartite motif containing 63 [Paramarasmius palmivorus]|uniref:Tripartite motif containing 63 n=1 Tax=Paramarasmius palmivorus TaxID=297713 RepID=A0AAW0BZ36_9AGAR